jgi:hypothetical protein
MGSVPVLEWASVSALLLEWASVSALLLEWERASVLLLESAETRRLRPGLGRGSQSDRSTARR